VRWTCREGRVAYYRPRPSAKPSSVGKLCFVLRVLAIALIVGLFFSEHASAQSYVVKDGNAKSVIVLQDGANEIFDRKLPDWSDWRHNGDPRYDSWLQNERSS